ncbi:hypothetical protein JCM8208_000782 [Rhodotorula glutinis]
MDGSPTEGAIPATLDFPTAATARPRAVYGHPSHSPAAAPSPASSTATNKRKSVGADAHQHDHKAKAKATAHPRDHQDDDSDDDGQLGTDGKPKKKRNRVALSCAECKRRKIKCDRVMPVCGNCTKRGRPSECAWDVFQPSNDAFLPPSIARTSELESLAHRLAHVERYLQTLPPNFALFRPMAPGSGASAGGGAAGAGQQGGGQVVQAGRRGQGARADRDGEEGYSDTEDAAVSLENGVFASRVGLDTTNPSTKPSLLPPRPPLQHASSSMGPGSSLNGAGGTAGSSTAGGGRARRGSHVRFGAPPLELTKALTCIVSSASASAPSASLKAHLLVDFDATLDEVRDARTAEVERIVRTLPGRQATAFLVERYFGSVNWLFHHLHAPSFRAELDAFHALCDASRADDVDLTWLALLLMVLCLALDSMHYSRSPLALSSSSSSSTPSAGAGASSSGAGTGKGDDVKGKGKLVGEGTPLEQYSEEQLKALPERWHAASVRALKLAEWEKAPRIRSIQTIVLYTQYLQLSSAARGQPSQLVWLAGAIRLAQVLNLHLLGSNPETMPPEDPAFPPGKNSLKREMAKRLWAVLVYQDWLAANSKNRCYLISPVHCDTDDPLNVNDTDLSPSTTALAPAPSSVLTDSSADRVRIAMARQVRAVFDRVVLARDWGYDTVLDLDSGFRTILAELPERWTLAADEQEDPMLRFQRHFVLEGLHNRIFRLHRPLLSKAHKNPKYKFSAEACLKSARAVVVSTHNIREAVADVPYTYSHVFGAALVLFNDLFQAIDHDGSATEIDSKVETLQLALEIFTSKPSSAALSHTVQQAHKILSGLFREEERRRQARAAKALMRAAAGQAGQDPDGLDDAVDDQGTFADVLHRIARSLDADSAPHRGTPPPTRNLPSSKKGGAPSASLAAAVMPASYLAAGGAAATSGSTALFPVAGAADLAVPVLAAPLGGTSGVGSLGGVGVGEGGADVYAAPDSSMGLTSLAPAASSLPPVPSSLTPDSSWPFSTPGDGTSGGGMIGAAGGAAGGGFSSAFDAADGLDFGLGAFGFASGDPFGLGLGGEAGMDLEVGPGGGGVLGGGMMGAGGGGGGLSALESFAMPDGGQPSWDLGAAAASGQQTVGMTDAEAAAAYWGQGGAGGRSGSGW